MIFLVDFLLFVDTEFPSTSIDNDQQTPNNAQGLEELVLQEVSVGVVGAEVPELVDVQVVREQQHRQHERSKFGLVAHNNGPTRHKSRQDDGDSAKRPRC